MFDDEDIYYMGLALREARAAYFLNEVPIGAVVVNGSGLLARAGNRREIDKSPCGHAEFLAIQSAAKHLGRWRLSDCVVYVTVEPCLMCAGLMYQARIARCVFALADPKAGALGSLYSIHNDTRLNHRFRVDAGLLEDKAADLLHDFFLNLRQDT